MIRSNEDGEDNAFVSVFTITLKIYIKICIYVGSKYVQKYADVSIDKGRKGKDVVIWSKCPWS